MYKRKSSRKHFLLLDSSQQKHTSLGTRMSNKLQDSLFNKDVFNYIHFSQLFRIVSKTPYHLPRFHAPFRLSHILVYLFYLCPS